MGNMTELRSWLGAPLHRGGHNHDVAAITNAAADPLTALTNLTWTTRNPTIVKSPKPTSVKRADKVEAETGRFEIAVDQGVRVLRAEARRQKANAKLQTAHRQYLGQVADAQLQMSSANTRLASRLHANRVEQAELGYGLERSIVTADQRIAQIAAKYGAI